MNLAEILIPAEKKNIVENFKKSLGNAFEVKTVVKREKYFR